jgi:hypothetical protein
MKKEIFEGKRTFIVWVVATVILLALGILQVVMHGEMPSEGYLYWWFAVSGMFVGKNYLESKDTKKYVSMIQSQIKQ